MAPHLFSTREPSEPPSPEPNYARVAAALGTREDDLIRVKQVHGRAVIVVRPGDREDPAEARPEADAIVSIDPDRAVAVRVADCVPVLLADSGHRLVAAVHAGWRGMAAGAIGAAIDAIAANGVKPADLVAAIGPSIGPCCYQVDQVVCDMFHQAWSDCDAWFAPDGKTRWRLDLWSAARDQLLAAGVPREGVHIAAMCTAHQPDDFWSYRRDGAAAGRMVAAIALEKTTP
jgi:YfiH family protein